MVDGFRRLENHRLVTVTQRYLSALRDQQLRRVCEDGCREFTLALLNVRSLSAHALDVAKDPVLSRVDLLCLTETWNRSSAINTNSRKSNSRITTGQRPAGTPPNHNEHAHLIARQLTRRGAVT
ncbi:hypothetical protein HPB52_009809 [Rhipicephalus sanguineus]|uniref:Uncharacterized protein n=1 Tax=Rhipicephalus sanguineus TaxID=34632 RepID=A0A9D4QD64_RHISA|nr:hypothetical protein HPB52_009809 [Rhipicephalus sanguineus]